MFRLPYVPTADGLIDKTFRRGSKEAKIARSTRKRRPVRLKKSELKRVETIGKLIVSELTAIIRHFPSYETLPVFYQKLLDVKIDKDRYKKSLGALQWASNTINSLTRKTLKNIRIEMRTDLSKDFLGRVSSIVKQVSPDLDRLIEIKSIFRTFPDIKDFPTLVVAGYPNVGKSTFMGNLTGSGVKIASYPFTTKDIQLGYSNIRHQKYQIIDLPGLLDRPIEKRNKIELQAIMAIQELADVLLFIFDPTLDFDTQQSLLKEIEDNFDLRIIIAINKVDLVDKGDLKKLRKNLKDYYPLEMSAKDPADCEMVFKKIFLQ